MKKLVNNRIKIIRVSTKLQASLQDRKAVTVKKTRNIYKSTLIKTFVAVWKYKDWFNRKSIEPEEVANNSNLARNNNALQYH